MKSVTLHVFQPAIDHISTWDIPVSELYNWVHGELALGISKCYSDNPDIVPGDIQCRWCEAKNHCDTRFSLVQLEAKKIFDNIRLLPKKTPGEIADLLNIAPFVEQGIKDIKLFASNEIQRGQGIPGYKLVGGRTNRKWKNEKATIEWLSANTEIEDLFVSKLVSPAQAEKLAKFLKKSPEFQELWEKAEGAPTLVPLTDSRPALPSTSRAIDVFSDYVDSPDKLE